VIVVDASVLVAALADDADGGDFARQRLRGERLFAPDLVDLEVLSVLRRQVGRGRMPLRRAALAIQDLAEIPIGRAAHRPLISRCWELRDALGAYDSAYVALAEMLGAPLVTADGRIARARGPRCAVEVLSL
jgi:predicted nucleic acid-binding protein